MSDDEHQQRHIELHKAFDELLADFISEADGKPSDSILDLVKWSHKQSIQVDHGFHP